MELEKIIVQTEDFLSLQKDICDGKLAKTILLITQDEYYSYEFARILASCIFNEGDLQESQHSLKVKALSHPDLKIYPQKEKLMVADSESIVEESSIKPIFADKKIIIIKNIDNAMEQAQNKLLKTLEEPASNVHFILTTTSLDKVLPTIRSRCNKIELSLIPQAQTKKLCEGDELVAVLSQGYVGKVLTLKEKENLKNLFDSVFSCITSLKSSKQLLTFSKKLSLFKEDFNIIVEIFSLIMEDILFIKTGKKNRINFKENLSATQMVESEYTLKAVNEIRKLLDKAVKEMSFNCNFTLVIENLLLNILEVKYLCR